MKRAAAAVGDEAEGKFKIITLQRKDDLSNMETRQRG